MGQRRHIKGNQGELFAQATRAFQRLRGPADDTLVSTVLKAEQSNTSVIYGDRLILKLFRRPDEGVNPELEIGRFLAERVMPVHTPALAGFIEYRRRGRHPLTVAILQSLEDNQGDAWQYSLDRLEAFFERALTTPTEQEEPTLPAGSLLDIALGETPETVASIIGPYLESARTLGHRTAELHMALASSPDDPHFPPEPITPFYQRSLYQSLRNLAARVFQTLRRRLPDLPEEAKPAARQVLESEQALLAWLRPIVDRKLSGSRIRCHGDFHLGQILRTGMDFVVIDFEGEPERPLSERRVKRSPMCDVAGLVRSFHYAAYGALFAREDGGSIRPQDVQALEPWARYWYVWVSASFLGAYLAAASEMRILPADRDELEVLLDAHILEKAVYELGYELNNRPDWVRVPLQSILDLLSRGPAHAGD
jgi:maltose alpha-D-glucosyltransferase/alpha-amylase